MFFKKKANPEFNSMLHKLDGILKYTPDLAELQQFAQIRVFIPDEVQVGHHQNYLLGKGVEHIGSAFTVSSEFCMWTRRLGKLSQAVALDNPTSTSISPQARIKGQLFLVGSDSFISLDNYKENGVHFTRRRVPLLFKYRWQQKSDGGYQVVVDERRDLMTDAFMYVGKPEFWDKEISMDMYKRVSRYYGLGKERFDYYCFTQSEYNSD